MGVFSIARSWAVFLASIAKGKIRVFDVHW